jgi:hypothetical protein
MVIDEMRHLGKAGWNGIQSMSGSDSLRQDKGALSPTGIE